MSAPQRQRRPPIVVGCHVEHIDGRAGIVLELVGSSELPEAIVDFEPRDRREPHTREPLALGFIVWTGHGTPDRR